MTVISVCNEVRFIERYVAIKECFMLKDFLLKMGEEELRVRMLSDLKRAIRKESRRRTDDEGKLVSMTLVINETLKEIFKTDINNLKEAIRKESRRRTDEEGTLVSMNSIINEILEKAFLK